MRLKLAINGRLKYIEVEVAGRQAGSLIVVY